MDVNLGLWSVIGNLISRLLVRVWNIRGWNVRAWTVRALVIARAVVVLWVVGPLVIVRRVVVWIAIISVVLIRVIASAKIDSHASATECDANATVQPTSARTGLPSGHSSIGRPSWALYHVCSGTPKVW